MELYHWIPLSNNSLIKKMFRRKLRKQFSCSQEMNSAILFAILLKMAFCRNMVNDYSASKCSDFYRQNRILPNRLGKVTFHGSHRTRFLLVFYFCRQYLFHWPTNQSVRMNSVVYAKNRPGLWKINGFQTCKMFIKIKMHTCHVPKVVSTESS